MKTKNVYLDIDGVLADFISHFFNYLNIEDKTPPNNWFDDRIVNNFNIIKDDENFWLTMPPLTKASNINFKFNGYCTNRMLINPTITEKWLELNNFPKLPVYCTNDKLSTLKKLNCDLFIDDSIENYELLNQGGIKTYLFTNSTNINYNTNLRINNISEFSIFTKYNILVIGHKEHGKSTFAELLSTSTNYKHKDSSLMACELFIFNLLKNKYNYKTIEECYIDRRNKREEWYKLISNYNEFNKTRLIEDILKTNEIYVGLRSIEELKAGIERGLFDLIIGVFDERKPLEESNSFTIDIFKYSDFIVHNNSTINDLTNKINKIKTFL